MIKRCRICNEDVYVRFSRFKWLRKIFDGWYLGKHVEKHSYSELFEDRISPV